MKKFYSLSFFCVLFLSMIFISCQKEAEEFINDSPNDETITANSTLTNLLLRTSQNPGSADNIIDGNSCSAVVYPVSVIVNGQDIEITSEADLVIIQQIYDQFPNDNDTLEIVFPINVVLENFTEITINNQTELQALIAACDTSNSEITCVDFIYPITFFVYNADQEQTSSVTVNNDVELFLFLFGLDNNNYISIDFPISVTLSDGTITEVNSNQQLQTIIADCINENNDPEDTSEQIQNLTTGNWYLTYYFDDYDETNDFNGYEFTFDTDNTAEATNGSNTVNGTWIIAGSNNDNLSLFFGNNNPFDELDEDWSILEITSEVIRLKHISGGDGSVDFLTFERDPGNGSNPEVNMFIEDLTTGIWYINLFQDNNDDETSNYQNYEFTFTTSGAATAVSNDDTVNGFWSVQDNGNNDLDVIFNFENSGNDDPFEELNNDWDILQFSSIIIRVSDIRGNGQTDLLNFGRDPYDGGSNDPDPEELRNIMESGTWYVDTFLDDGDDETSDFNGYDFTFLSNGNIIATNGSENVAGEWEITVDSSELRLDFDMDSPLNSADDHFYRVFEYSETEITFVTYNNDGVEDTLIFKKN